MAANLSSCHGADEDYIDIELSSTPNLFCFSDSTCPHTREFEFQMSSTTSNGRDSTTSPADELFYNGKLLPLYLPPRLQMVQTLLQSSTYALFETTANAPLPKEGDEHCSIPLISTAPSTNVSTPLESCNISPAESCRVSCELNPAEFFFEWSTEFSSFINASRRRHHQSKNSWSKRLKMIRQSSLPQKLKAYRAYLKSLFSKSACSDETCAKAAAGNAESEQGPKGRDFSSKFVKVGEKAPFGHVGRGAYPTIASLIDREVKEENLNSQRRSFSGAIKRHSPSKCISSSSSSSSSGASSSFSSFSVNSNALYESHSSLKGSSSDSSDVEISIESAIAHCKNSQLACNSGSPSSDGGFFSLPISAVTPSENLEKASACRM